MIFWIFCTLINIFSHYSRKLPELEMPIVPLMTTLLALFKGIVIRTMADL